MRLAAKVLLPGTGWVAFTQLMERIGLMMDLFGKRILPRGSLALLDFHTITAVWEATISFKLRRPALINPANSCSTTKVTLTNIYRLGGTKVHHPPVSLYFSHSFNFLEKRQRGKNGILNSRHYSVWFKLSSSWSGFKHPWNISSQKLCPVIGGKTKFFGDIWKFLWSQQHQPP